MPNPKITDRHKEVIWQQVAAYHDSPKSLAEFLADPSNGERFGFEPVQISRQRVAQVKDEATPEQIEELRREYLKDFDNIPLSHKKIRVQELAKMYEEIEGAGLDKWVYRRGKGWEREECSHSEVIQTKQALLGQIRAEMGETVEKLRGDTNITIINPQERFNERLSRALDLGANVIGKRN